MVYATAEPADPAPYVWQLALRREMAALGRDPGGRFADLSDSRYTFVPATELLEPARLRELILRAGGLETLAAQGGGIPDLDLTIAVSRFTRQYCGAVSGPALVGLAQGVGITMSPKRCYVALANLDKPVTARRFVVALDLTNAEVLRCAGRPTSLPVTGPAVATVAELREYVWSRLFGVHYEQLFRAVREVAPSVSPALLWTSAAEYVGGLSHAAQQHLSAVAAAPYAADCRLALEGEALPGVDGPNPMRGTLTWEPAGPDCPRGVLTRQMCCLNYLLPDRDGRLCENCPYLPPEDRLALIREREGRPPGSTGGPAERRAKEAGQSRRSYQQRHRLATSQL